VLGTIAAVLLVMKTFHAAVWLDHGEARIFHIAKDTFDGTVIQAEEPHKQVHRKSGPGANSGRRAHIDATFCEDITRELAGSEEILLLGPSTAKLELIKHMHKHHPAVAHKVIGVETVDHPSDRQLVTYARQYFEVADAKS
jgi:stalled ribosome rescue protein Dom34